MELLSQLEVDLLNSSATEWNKSIHTFSLVDESMQFWVEAGRDSRWRVGWRWGDSGHHLIRL